MVWNRREEPGEPLAVRRRESALRKIVRDEWPLATYPIWVEAAHGGTDGAPDLLWPIDRLYLPVELKAWDLVNGRVMMKARPSQRRFHTLAARVGSYTAFLAILPDDRLCLVPGKHFMTKCPVENPLIRIVGARDLGAVVRTLIDEDFWREY